MTELLVLAATALVCFWLGRMWELRYDEPSNKNSEIELQLGDWENDRAKGTKTSS